MASFNEPGIEYTEANFAYNKNDATVSPNVVATTSKLNLSTSFKYTTNTPTIGYNQTGLSYNPPPNVGPDYVVIGFPASVPVVTTAGGTGSVPVTIVAGVIGCTAQVADHTGPLIINLDMDYIEIAVHVPTLVALPAATISSIVKPANIDIDAAVHGHVLIITTTVNPDAIGVAAALPAPSVSANFAYAQQIPVKTIATLPTIPLFARLTLHVFNRTPTVGRPQDTTPAAYALRRHYVPLPQGENVFIIDNAIVQTFLPADTATVTRWIYGAHVPPTDLTLTEVSLLQAAGYQFDVGPE